MASPVLGIDLGTTNSVVACADSHRVRVLRDENANLLTPSTVSFHPSGQILIGHPARERRLVDSENTVFSVKRLIGRPYRSPEVRRAAERLPFQLEEGATGGVMVRARGEAYSLPEISSFVLRELRKIAEEALGQSCVNAVVTVPANFNELQRMATRDAGRIAGLHVLRILNEPTAAALAYGYRASSNQRIAVYDLGGGTFDVSILELSGDVIEVVATAGDTYLGGDDIDRLIADRMVAEFLAKHHVDLSQDPQAYDRVCIAAEWIKCQLSLLENAEATVQEVAYASGGQPLHLVFQLARSDLDQMIFKLIGRTFDICEDALRLAGLRPSQLDGVILVGGQTRTPKVREMVGEYFGMPPQSSVDPDLVVAQGAALQGFALAGKSESMRPSGRTLSGTPPPRSSPPSGFEDQPTTMGKRRDLEALATPFDEQPTTVTDRPTDEVTEPDAMAGVSPRGTLTGFGSKSPPIAPPLSGPLPKPPPLAAVLATARQSQETTSSVGRTLAQTPRAKLGQRPSGAAVKPPGSPEVPSVPAAPRVPSEVDAFPMAQVQAPAEDLPAVLRAVVREPPPPPLAAPAAAPVVASATEPPPADREPIRTQSMARLLAAQGHGDRARAIYDDLLAKAPGDPSLRAEADALGRTPSPLAQPASAPLVAATQSQFPAPARPQKPLLLLDVTPHTLSVETAGGFCEQVIERNAPIPTEQTRVFSTSQDNQTVVSMRVSQGEARRIDENQVLGQLELTGLRHGRRGEVTVAVTFIIDADGTLHVKAQDRATGQAQAIRVKLVGALGEQDIERMSARQGGTPGKR